MIFRFSPAVGAAVRQLSDDFDEPFLHDGDRGRPASNQGSIE
jgi:hypothetical protein